MTNIFGQAFDITMPGKHTLVHLPMGVSDSECLLKMTCEVKLMSATCADMYIQSLNMTGAWVDEKGEGVFMFSAQSGHIRKGWMQIGRVHVKVVRGMTRSRIRYLNVFTKHLASLGVRVGGILGEGDHTFATMPQKDCVRTMDI